MVYPMGVLVVSTGVVMACKVTYNALVRLDGPEDLSIIPSQAETGFSFWVDGDVTCDEDTMAIIKLHI